MSQPDRWTDEAKALDVKELCFTLFGCYMADAPEAKLLAHALAEARREERETIATYVEDGWVDDFGETIRGSLTIADAIRAQAQGGGDEKYT